MNNIDTGARKRWARVKSGTCNRRRKVNFKDWIRKSAVDEMGPVPAAVFNAIKDRPGQAYAVCHDASKFAVKSLGVHSLGQRPRFLCGTVCQALRRQKTNHKIQITR